MRWQYSLPYRPRTFPSPRGLPEVVSFARSRLRLGRRRQIGHSERQRSCRYPQASVLFPGIVPSHARFKLEHPPRPKVVILRIVERRPPGRRASDRLPSVGSPRWPRSLASVGDPSEDLLGGGGGRGVEQRLVGRLSGEARQSPNELLGVLPELPWQGDGSRRAGPIRIYTKVCCTNYRSAC